MKMNQKNKIIKANGIMNEIELGIKFNSVKEARAAVD